MHFFSFKTLNISFHYLLASMLCDRKSDVTDPCSSIGKVLLTPQAAFKIYCLSLVWFSAIRIWLDVDSFDIYPFQCSLNVLDLCFVVCH